MKRDLMNSRFLSPVLVLGLSLMPLLSGCGEEAPAQQQQQQRQAEPVEVSVAPATVGSLPRTIEVVGSLHGDEETTLSAKVSGRVVAIFKDVGDRAEPGEPLAQIDPTDYELALNQKRMAMQQTLAELGLEQMPGDDFDLTKVPTVQRASLQAANAKARWERGEKLFNQKPPLISEQDYADLQTAYEVANSDYNVALLQARATLAEARTAQAEMELAERQLADTVVRAPLSAAARPATTQSSGAARYAIATRSVEVGEYVAVAATLFRVVADDPVKYRANVPERFLSRLAVGQEIHIVVESSPKKHPGRVTRISPQVDPATRTVLVEATFENANRELRPGNFARGAVTYATDPEVTFVPASAVVTFAGVTRVFTVEDGKAVEHPVELGMRQGDLVEIVKGLKAPAEVIVTNTGKLAKGVPVTVVTPTATTQSTTSAD